MGKPNKYKNNLGLSANAHEFSLAGLGCKNEKEWLKAKMGKAQSTPRPTCCVKLFDSHKRFGSKDPKGQPYQQMKKKVHTSYDGAPCTGAPSQPSDQSNKCPRESHVGSNTWT